MSNQFTNPQLLDMFSDHVPTENGKSSDAILAEFGNNDQGDWALVIQFEAKEIQENDPFTGPTTRLNVITKRAMINAPEGMIAKLHALPTYPVLEGLSGQNTAISVDTSKPEVMKQAINAGAFMINDVNALRNTGALEVVAQYRHVRVCLMHMQGIPIDMQSNPQYQDIVSEIKVFLQHRIAN